MARPDGMGTVHLPGSVHAAWSDVSAGDLRPVGHGPRDGASLAAFATSVAAPTGASLDEVDWVTQVHGARVVEVSRAVAVTGTTGATTPVDPDHVPCRNLGAADALVADSGGIAVCVLTADCAPLALASPEGVFAAVHAGWRGLVAGVVDATRAPRPQEALWGYCHVPSGSTVDMSAAIEAQIDRFAPGFGDLVLARTVRTAAQEEEHNPNYVGGDIAGGASTLLQTVFRPTVRWNPYRTPLEGVYLCSASTAPGAGVHGMCGVYAARTVLHDHFGGPSPLRA